MKTRKIFISISFFFLTFIVQGQPSNNNVDGNNWFAFSLYKDLFSKNNNVFFSPYSISTALAMTYAGARGETEKQMRNVLHFNTSQDKTHSGFEILNKDLKKLNNDSTIKLSIANALWKSESWHFKKEFLDLTKKYYDAAIYPLNNATPINEWADKNTNGKIKKIVTDEDIGGARLVLTNAIYFKGDWQWKFDSSRTSKSKFKMLDGTLIDVNMMYQENNFKYYEDEKNQVIQLQYKNETLSMTVILPKATSSILELTNKMNNDLFKKYTSNLFSEKVKTYFPKFTIKSSYNLENNFSKMGMTNAFNPIKADFSGMSQGLSISKIIHKAFFEVNEKGSEAAAVTAVIMKESSFGKKEIVFNVNRPFMFFITDNKNGSILFMGSVINPLLND